MRSACLLVATVFATASATAADLIEVTPISDRIIALVIGEGSVSRAVAGQSVNADTITVSPLTTTALSAGAFSISSSGHAAYAGGQPASALNRKAKGTAFTNTADNWQWSGPRGTGYYPATQTWASTHWVYLTLPTALQSGATYTVTWNATALNLAGGSTTFRFQESSLRSEAIHVNTLGFLPTALRKFGYLYQWAGDRGGLDYSAWAGRPFRVVEAASGTRCLSGTVAFRKAADNQEMADVSATPNGNFLGAAVWECDFSALTTPGTYRLVIDGIGCSYPFRIADDIYADPFARVMNTLYQNRSGLALVAPWTDEPRPAPHRPGVTPGFTGRLKYSTFRNPDMESQDAGSANDKTAIEAAARGVLTSTWGWYQDAGDWDGYITHGKIPIQLTLLYLQFPDRFRDGQLRLPEAGNGMPDILDEAAWLPRYFHRLRQELLTKGWGTGGVGARVFGDQWGEDSPNGIRRGSWQDVDRDWYVTGEDPFATYRYAAMAALLAEAQARAGRSDPEGVDWQAEAVAAYTWAGGHVASGDTTRDYDGSLASYRMLAAVALYRRTGQAAYHQDFLTASAGITTSTGLGENTLWAATLYLTLPTGRSSDATRAATLRSALLDSTLFPWTLSVGNRALRWSGNWWFPAQIGQATTPMVEPLILADPVRRPTSAAQADDYRSMVQTTCDYFLGGNPLHTTWMTRVGPRPITGVFHLDDWALGNVERAGMIPYGPNRIDYLWFYWPTEIPASPVWGYKSAYPPLSSVRTGDPDPIYYGAPGNWPLHEVWFNQAYTPQTCEFTIHQTQINAALAFGYLLPVVTNQAPVISAAAAAPATLALP
jgi:endoglucanase